MSFMSVVGCGNNKDRCVIPGMAYSNSKPAMVHDAAAAAAAADAANLYSSTLSLPSHNNNTHMHSGCTAAYIVVTG
jgi:hypothetical protein